MHGKQGSYPNSEPFHVIDPTKFSGTHVHKKFRLPILVRNQCGMEGEKLGVVVRVSVCQDLEEFRIKKGMERVAIPNGEYTTREGDRCVSCIRGSSFVVQIKITFKSKVQSVDIFTFLIWRGLDRAVLWILGAQRSG
jgi:hypothetical protein